MRKSSLSSGQYQRLVLYATAFFLFLICWFLLTVLILVAHNSMFGDMLDDKPLQKNLFENTFAGKKVQVVVGHYNGNLPADLLKNLTNEELNANNYNPIKGFGENGKAVNLDIKNDLESEKTFGVNQFNLWISDRIALNRSLLDVRRLQCQKKIYPSPNELPTTSVIIVYHNEAYSTLARTITSVVNRSPREVLSEIILVDDFSNRTFLYNDLEIFVKNLSVRVKIVRAQERVGLIRARLMGAAEAIGDVLTFLDSHCECTKGWLEPLLARIKENRKVVVCPIIDVINDQTFAYQKGIELFRGGFNWNLQFRWYAVPSSVLKKRALDPTLPIESPTMAGGLFSINRKYFEELGTYDSEMDIWGGENIEISFRIWQCGGRLEILPCSHVGHIFRKSSPHDFPKGTNSGKVLNGNLVRVSEVWMDEWKYLFYKIAPQAASLSKIINVSNRIELRKRLFCKDFSWYLENVWPEHFMPTPSTVFGRLIHIASPPQNKNFINTSSSCLRWVSSATGNGHIPTLYPCTNIDDNGVQFISNNNTEKSSFKRWDQSEFAQYQSSNCLTSRPSETGKNHKLLLTQCTLGFDYWQLWVYSKNGQLKSDEHRCLSAIQVGFSSSQWIIQLKECGEHATEYWKYNLNHRTFVHQKSGFCLDKPIEKIEDGKTQVPSVRKCIYGKESQQWKIQPVKWLPNKLSF